MVLADSTIGYIALTMSFPTHPTSNNGHWPALEMRVSRIQLRSPNVATFDRLRTTSCLRLPVCVPIALLCNFFQVLPLPIWRLCEQCTLSVIQSELLKLSLLKNLHNVYALYFVEVRNMCTLTFILCTICTSSFWIKSCIVRVFPWKTNIFAAFLTFVHKKVMQWNLSKPD